eukprot:4874070-Prymnesium_polylepis.2
MESALALPLLAQQQDAREGGGRREPVAADARDRAEHGSAALGEAGGARARVLVLALENLEQLHRERVLLLLLPAHEARGAKGAARGARREGRGAKGTARGARQAACSAVGAVAVGCLRAAAGLRAPVLLCVPAQARRLTSPSWCPRPPPPSLGRSRFAMRASLPSAAYAA